jgi:beta-amylase
MVDMWWGVVERIGPKEYDWSAYKQLLGMVKAAGLKMQACMSFHACGANVGDVYEIPLPSWVLESALQDPDMLYTDQHGYRNPECLSLFADAAATVAGRTPLQCYGDFMRSFAREFGDDLGTSVTEVSVGCGPCGELRYPAYPENKRCPAASQWRFPGIGEFQCYDKRALLSLAQAASNAGHIEWGGAGPHDAGGYNDLPHETGFFKSYQGSWDSEYGQFFLGWYSGALVDHGERVMRTALEALDGRGLTLSLKCAGVHWWYNSRSHAAELTAGYWNTRQGDRVPQRDGYAPIIQLCAKLGVALNFTCVEMRDSEHPWDARCGPEGLLRQVRDTAAELSVPVMGENALCRFDREAYDRVVANAVGDAKWDAQGRASVPKNGTPPMASFTFLRLSPALFDEHNFPSFVAFVRRLREATGAVGPATEAGSSGGAAAAAAAAAAGSAAVAAAGAAPAAVGAAAASSSAPQGGAANASELPLPPTLPREEAPSGEVTFRF